MDSDTSLPLVVTIVFLVILFVIYFLIQNCIKQKEKGYRFVPQSIYHFSQNQPVYDISSQVESQGQWQSRANNSTVSSQPIGGLHPHIHPSGLSTDQINFSNELNKPANADDPPPSYEQAVRLASSSSSIAVNALSPPTVPSDELPPVPK